MHTDIASITRDPATKAALLAVTATGPWALFAGPDETRIDFSRPVACGTVPGTTSLPGSAQGAAPAWACFALVMEHHPGDTPLLLAEWRLPMAGGYNFRDLGGFSGAHGKRVAWGKFIRADGLSDLTDADLAYLSSMPVATLVDFRTEEEVTRWPDKIPTSIETMLHLPITPGNLTAGKHKKYEEYDSPDEFMLDMYRHLALDNHVAAAYRAFFARVQAEDGPPLLFHCSAGKDRTGVAAALILFALGVDRETILEDYETSNSCLDGKYASLLRERPDLAGLLTVKRAFLEEALALIEAEYGTIPDYLENVLDVDIAALQRRFLA